MWKKLFNNPNTIFQIYPTDSSLQVCLNWKHLWNYSIVSYLKQQVHLVDIGGHITVVKYTAGVFPLWVSREKYDQSDRNYTSRCIVRVSSRQVGRSDSSTDDHLVQVSIR